MKKINILIAFSLLSTYILSAQITSYEWAKTMGGPYTDQGQSVAVDNLGNIYTTGNFHGTVDFDPGPDVYNLTTTGGFDSFIQKLDANGNLLWVKQIEETTVVGTYNNSRSRGMSIAVDALGNVYTSGDFQGITDFDPSSSVYSMTSNGYKDAYILKLNTNGEFLWAKQFGGPSFDIANAVAVDALGNVYSSGWFEGTVDFNPGFGVNNLTSEGLQDIYIQKLDANGNFVWAKSMGGPENDYTYSIALDPLGNVYSTGGFQGTVDFDPSSGNHSITAFGSSDIYIQKLDANGNFIWAKHLGGSWGSMGYSIVADSIGNVYSTGHIQGTVDFDPGVGVHNLISAGLYDIYIQKLDTDGNLIWVKQIGGFSHDVGKSITLDNNGDVYATGRFYGTVDFDPSLESETNLISQGSTDVFILKLGSQGNFHWAKSFGGNEGDSGNDIAVYNNEDVYSSGRFRASVNFDTEDSMNDEIVAIEDDIFLHKLNQCYPTMFYPSMDILPDLVASCTEITPTPPTATNGCDTIYLATTSTSFPITDQTITQLIWTYTDQHGNVINQPQNITWTNSMNVETTLNGFMLTADNPYGTYQWLDCNNDNSPLSGENNQTIIPTINGNYAVEITENGCIDTSVCVLITTVGVPHIEHDMTLAVYPNPSSGLFNLLLNKSLDMVKIVVTNIQGQIVYNTEFNNLSKAQMDLNHMEKGLYFLSIISINGQKTVEIIKE